jgi:serine/threonine protein kinase/tetratricopeptide (TPR) repeat protein
MTSGESSEPADFTWERLEELFEQAHALPPEARQDFLWEQCADQPALRAQIEAMLAAAEGDRALHIERLVVDARPQAAKPDDDPASDPWLEQRLGPWRLTRIIGRGGMGVVYGAERADGQYQLDVAIKLMRDGPRDGQAIDRFRTERQVLASLKHPSIASLLDGGFASDGTPYLVMELVDGVPITEWCRPPVSAEVPPPSLERRLRLFQIVCDAVQHAHRALVVHRDLKPRNIFVTRSGDVKLLDFGIAKLLEPEAWGLPPTETRMELRAFTPDYAAPEQIHGGAITTATDVYALGVVLYEMVTGVRPVTVTQSDREHRQGGGRSGPQASADTPTTLTPPSEAVRRGQQGDERGFARRIRGDLDRIILTALREEPERRYASAGQLGEEVGRFLDGRAVLAQPDTLEYRVRTFVRRNRLAVATSAVFLASVITFGAVSAWQARVLFEQRRVAQLERDTSEQVVRVLIDLFEATNPAVRPDGDRIPLGEFLRDAQTRALAGLREAPAVRAKLQHVLGSIQYTRGAYGPARGALEEALALQRQLAGPDHPDTLESLHLLGQVALYGGEEARARSLLEESLDRHRRVHGERHPLTARALFALAPIVAAGDLDRAGVMLRDVLEIRQATLPANHPDIAGSLAALGGYAQRRGNFAEAREFYRRALDTYPTAQDRRNPAAITILGDFATLLNRMREYDEAGKLQREAIELGEHVLGARSITVANLQNNLGTTQALAGRHAEAEQSFRAAFETHRVLLGDDHRRTRNVARNVGRALVLQQRYAEALTWMDRALGADASEDAGVLGIRAQRAHLLFRLGRKEEAIALAAASVTSLEGLARDDTAAMLAGARVLLGRMLIEVDRPGAAEPILNAALQWLDRLGADHPQRAEAACELARVRVLNGARVEGLTQLRQCLPVYKSWGLAEREVVTALERLK